MVLFRQRPTRIAAALIHLATSALVVGTVAALMFGLWYPGPFRHLAGGLTLFFIIASVDVVLGPLLTLVVFNPVKSRRELSVDLGVILAVQVAALAYGVWTMAAARPVALAFEIDLYRVVTAADVVEEQLPEATPDLRALSWGGPVTIGTDRPGGERTVEATMLGLGGVHLAMQPRYWRPYDTQRTQAWERGRPVAQLPPELQRRLGAELQAWPGNAVPPLDGLRWLPLMSGQQGVKSCLLPPLSAQQGSSLALCLSFLRRLLGRHVRDASPYGRLGPDVLAADGRSALILYLSSV